MSAEAAADYGSFPPKAAISRMAAFDPLQALRSANAQAPIVKIVAANKKLGDIQVLLVWSLGAAA